MTRVLPLLALSLFACGGPARRPAPPPRAVTHPRSLPSAPASAAPSDDALAGFDAIAAASLLAWPGSKESLRNEATVKDALSIDIAPAVADTCVRVFVRAASPVEARLVGKGEAVLSEGRGVDVALGGKGPVCVRKGEPLLIAIKGDARVRVLVRSSP